jgi:hypothetical protein
MLNAEETGFVQGVLTERGFRAEYINGKGAVIIISVYEANEKGETCAAHVIFSIPKGERVSKKKKTRNLVV